MGAGEVVYKEPTFENVYVGESFGPVELTLDPFFFKSYDYDTDDYTGMRVVDGEIEHYSHEHSAAIVAAQLLLFLTVYDPAGVGVVHERAAAANFTPGHGGGRQTMT